jgi:integrase
LTIGGRKGEREYGLGIARLTTQFHVGIFTQASKWGYWQEKNPAIDGYVGKQRAVREKRKLTDEQTRQLLDALPEDVRLICMMALFCTLRISEVLGLQWKHIDWVRCAVRCASDFIAGIWTSPRRARRNGTFRWVSLLNIYAVSGRVRDTKTISCST